MSTITTIPYNKLTSFNSKQSLHGTTQGTSTSSYFTPIFIVVALCIALGGMVGIQFFDRLFAGTEFRNAVRMGSITIIINIIVLAFLIMSFSQVKSASGPLGPRGNKGPQGNLGANGSLNMCGDTILRSADIRQHKRSSRNIDLTPPTIINN